ncbi:MAG: SpoVA/SpoVAEb family sporulation membrane protein [Limnochordales bacterium]|nr:SpoVA/SpoVAEb family sporulation membrane protein [Limnochordales bacterium]
MERGGRFHTKSAELLAQVTWEVAGLPDPEEERKRQAAEFAALAAQYHPHPPLARNLIFAFLVGGSICAIGQLFIALFQSLGMTDVQASARASITLLALGSLLTGLGVYDEIGRVGGAGAAIPITGFANSIVSPAMEYRTEGLVFGFAARLFSIAGPVVTFGILAAMASALIRFLVTG